MLKKIAILCLAFILGIAILPRLTLAQSTGYLESRLSRVESDNFQLRSQIDRIESQLNRLTSRADFPRVEIARPTPAPLPPRATPRVNRQTTSQDPMFSRLATLVIELKERVKALEAQVAQLKRQQSGR